MAAKAIADAPRTLAKVLEIVLNGTRPR